MPSTASVLPRVMEALADLWATALADLEHDGEQVGVQVVDGATTESLGPVLLLVGVSDPDEPDGLDAGTTSLQWASLGALARDDQGAVSCTIAAASGDASGSDALRRVRRLAVAVLDAAHDAVLTATPSHPWLGVQGAVFGRVADVRIRQGMTRNGPVVHVIFTVQFRARV